MKKYLTAFFRKAKILSSIEFLAITAHQKQEFEKSQNLMIRYNRINRI